MVDFIRIKGLTQKSVATKMATTATELLNKGYTIISMTQYADSESIGRNKAGTIYYST